MRAPEKILTYLALLGGAAVFALPFFWMLSTALKPLDQTVAQPPAWLPRRYFVESGGARSEVRPGALITRPGAWAVPAGSDRAVVIPSADIVDGVWQPAGGRSLPLQVLAPVPASPENPWREITHLADGRREPAPQSAIRAEVSLRWENFAGAMRAMGEFPRYFANTVLLCALNVIGAVASSALAAYGFARLQWPGRDRVFAVALATMMIPFPVVMVPLYVLFRELGWIGTLQPLWVGSFCAAVFNVFLLRQFFRTIPAELSEAARIDGCGELRIFWQIILPLCRPALVVVALFTFLGTWNDFLGPLIYLTDQRDFTLALALQSFQTRSGGTDWHHLMAASTLVILPIIALFLAAQRSFVEGIATTGGKA